MALVFTGSLAKFHQELSHIPDLLAGTEHLESFRKTSQYRAWENSLLYISRELLMSKIKDDCGVHKERKARLRVLRSAERGRGHGTGAALPFRAAGV